MKMNLKTIIREITLSSEELTAIYALLKNEDPKLLSKQLVLSVESLKGHSVKTLKSVKKREKEALETVKSLKLLFGCVKSYETVTLRLTGDEILFILTLLDETEERKSFFDDVFDYGRLKKRILETVLKENLEAA